jgi:flap endonuclease-1
MKSGELEKRGERCAEALAAIEKAKEEGDLEEVDKQSRRIVKVQFAFTFFWNCSEV